MNHKQVAERWIAQGRNRAHEVEGHGNNVFYEGDTIYSYGHHFPIARLTGKYTPEGAPIALFTTRDYSHTTSKHKSIIRWALYQARCAIVEVNNPTDTSAELATVELEDRIVCAEQKKQRARVHKATWQENINAYKEQIRIAAYL